jgi:transposase-like protein
MVVADAHRGIQAAARRHLLGSCYQRCKVHLMRNILGRVSHRDKKAFSEKLKQIWVQPDCKSAVRTARIFMAEYRQRYPEAIAVLAEGLEDSLQFYAFPEMDPRKISSTNVLERLNKEIRRRSRVVGVFPSEDSYVRLLCCYLIEYTEDWEHEKSYVRKEAIDQLRVRREEAA